VDIGVRVAWREEVARTLGQIAYSRSIWQLVTSPVGLSHRAQRYCSMGEERFFTMELIAEILTNPTTGALDAEWLVQSDDVRASQRRIEPRFPTKRLTAIYSIGSGDSKRMFCSILDVSQHGMRVRTAHPLTPGTQVRVTLREMSAIARVCYCNRVNDGFDQGLHVQELRER